MPLSNLAATCRRSIEQHHMLTQGDRLVVGISGGADSVALLHVLRRIAKEYRVSLTAAHLNHNLRGEESDRDEAYVRFLCQKWEVPLEVASIDVRTLAQEQGRSIEECARGERYAFYDQVAAGGKVATGHTLDDSTETVLLNLARGTALRGLCGIPPMRENIIRPLIDCTRKEIEIYCDSHGLSYMIDSTNLSDQYTRNRLRNHVIPLLEKINPSLFHTIADTTQTLRADADYLDQLAQTALVQARCNAHKTCAKQLRALPDPLRLRALASLLREHGIPISQRRLSLVDNLLDKGGKLRLSGQWYGECREDALFFYSAAREKQETLDPIPLTDPCSGQKIQVFPDKSLQILPLEQKEFEKTINYSKNQFENAIDCDRISGTVWLRQRKPGDRIRLAGRGCTKTLKKLYNEAGLPPEQRWRVLVLAGENGLLWVEGFGAAEEVAADATSQRILSIEPMHSDASHAAPAVNSAQPLPI